MSDQTQADAATKGRIYNMTGKLADLSHRTDRNGQGYLYARFEGSLAGKPLIRSLMAFGAVYQNLLPTLHEGVTVRIRGDLGGVIKVIKVLPLTAAASTSQPAQGVLPVDTPANDPVPAKPLRARGANGRFAKAA